MYRKPTPSCDPDPGPACKSQKQDVAILLYCSTKTGPGMLRRTSLQESPEFPKVLNWVQDLTFAIQAGQFSSFRGTDKWSKPSSQHNIRTAQAKQKQASGTYLPNKSQANNAAYWDLIYTATLTTYTYTYSLQLGQSSPVIFSPQPNCQPACSSTASPSLPCAVWGLTSEFLR